MNKYKILRNTKRVENTILKMTIIITFVLVVSYLIYPFFISIEQANKWNIKKFNNTKNKLETILYECQQIYLTEYATQHQVDFNRVNLPDSIISKIEKENLYLEHIVIQQDNQNLTIKAKFNAYQSWNLRILNNVSIIYDSTQKYRTDIENKSLKSSTIYLGDGWEFYIDTDWL